MIVYDTRSYNGAAILFHATGSTLFSTRTWPFALLSAMISVVLLHTEARGDLNDSNKSGFFASMAALTSFAVVYRSQLAYGRYFGALSGYRKMAMKLYDLACLIIALCPNSSPDAEVLLRTLMRWITLYHKLSLARLHGELIDGLVTKGLMTDEEVNILKPVRERNLVVGLWIQHAVMQHKKQLFAGVPEPAFARIFQFVSDSNNQFSMALEIAEVPFPFPYAQICSVAVYSWMLLIPFAMLSEAASPTFGALLCFVSTWMLFSLNESGASLECPFITNTSNDLPIQYFDAVFDDNVSSLFYGLKPEVCPAGKLGGGTCGGDIPQVQSPKSEDDDDDDDSKNNNNSNTSNPPPTRPPHPHALARVVPHGAQGPILRVHSLNSIGENRATTMAISPTYSRSGNHFLVPVVSSTNRSFSSNSIRVDVPDNYRTNSNNSSSNSINSTEGRNPAYVFTDTTATTHPRLNVNDIVGGLRPPRVVDNDINDNVAHVLSDADLDNDVSFTGLVRTGIQRSFTESGSTRGVFEYGTASEQMNQRTRDGEQKPQKQMRTVKSRVFDTIFAHSSSHCTIQDLIRDKEGNPTTLRARGTFSAFL